jgi:hypothetical protein
MLAAGRLIEGRWGGGGGGGGGGGAGVGWELCGVAGAGD